MKTYPRISTPGPEQGTCWACGRYGWCLRGYCTECSLSGKDSPMISCRCGSVCKRRTVPGQQTFTCSPDCEDRL